MGHSRATTEGDGLAKHDRKHSLEAKENDDDQRDKDKQDGGDPWAKAIAYSCTTGYAGSNDSGCKPNKLPQIELVNHEPGSSSSDSTRQTSIEANGAVRNGESVLKKLAIAASPDAVLMGSGFQSVAQVSLRTDGIVEKSGKIVSSEALVVTPFAPVTRAVYAPAATTAETTSSPISTPISTPARVETTATAPASGNKPASGFEAVPQTSTRTEVAQISTVQTVDKSGVPVIRASDLVVKESTHGVKIEPASLAASTTLARDLSSPVVPAKDTAAATLTSTLVAKDANPTSARIENAASTPTPNNKVEVASTSQVSVFQSVAQVSLRTDGIVEKSGKIVSSEALVVTPFAPVTRAVYAPAATTAETISSPISTPISTPARVETTATAPASGNKPASGFEAVPQASTRTEVAQISTVQTVDKSGVPVIRASDLVVKESTHGVKIEPASLAASTTLARDLSSPVVPAKDTAAATLTSTLVAKDANPTSARIENAASTPTPNNKVEVASTSQVSGFQSVAQVSLRTDGIVEKSGKIVSSEALAVTPFAPVTRAVYAPAATTAETTSSPISTPARVETTATAPAVDKSGVPVIRASDLVVKESTHGVKIEPASLAASTTLARDLSSPVAPAKDTAAATLTSTLVAKDANPTSARIENAASTPTPNNKVEVASTSQVSAFQSVASASLRPDGVVEKNGKIVSSEALIVTPIAPVTRAVYAPAATTAETISSPISTPISTPARVETTATAPASGNKPASGFEAVPQTSTRTEVAQISTVQTVDKSGVPVIRASDLVVKESTHGAKIEPAPLAASTTLARDLSSPIAPAKDTAAATLTSTLVAKDANPTSARIENAASTPTPNNKVEVASTSQVSGFQSVASASLRPDGVVEKSGKIVSSEALVVTPSAPVTRAVYAPAATTAETISSPISTPARIETTATAPASGNKPASGFEAVPQASTRTEVAQISTVQTVDKSGVPVIRASDLVVKESTPVVKIEPAPLAASTTLARDLSSPIAPAKDTATLTSTLVAKDANPTSARIENAASTPTPNNKVEVASTSQVSGFQSVAQVSLRTDGIVEKSGKTVSSEALVVTPIAPVTRAVYAPAATTAETISSPISTPARVETTATAPASGNKPASGFEAVPQTSTRTEVAQISTVQTVDKSGVPVIRASYLVVKESTHGAKIEPASLAASTTLARDLSSPIAPAKDTATLTSTLVAKDANPTSARIENAASTPTPNNKVEVASTSQVSAFQSVASASLRPDGVVEKNGKTISAESFTAAPIVPVTKVSPSITTPLAASAAGADTVSAPNQISGTKPVSIIDSNPQSTIRTDAAIATIANISAVAKELTAKAEPTMRVLDNLQTAANSTAPKALGTEHGQIGPIGQITQLNQLNQPTTALSAALAAAINGRMLGHQTETTKPFTNGQGTAAMIDTSAVATTKGSIITVAANTKTEPGSGAGNRGEGVAPAKADAVSVNAEIRFPLGTKVKKSETEEGDDDGKTTTATSAKVFGAGGNGGAGTNSGTGTGTGTTNTANGQVIDPSVAGMIGGTITPKPFDLPPLEITDKENENGRATKSNGSNNNAANNAGNKVTGGPSQKEMSDALQALIEKRRKERTRKPTTGAGKKTPVYKPEKQRRCLVLKGDTLDSLAEQYLADSKSRRAYLRNQQGLLARGTPSRCCLSRIHPRKHNLLAHRRRNSSIPS
jgi:hypothetical protein